jgi:hypothetical protein
MALPAETAVNLQVGAAMPPNPFSACATCLPQVHSQPHASLKGARLSLPNLTVKRACLLPVAVPRLPVPRQQRQAAIQEQLATAAFLAAPRDAQI